MKYLHGLVVLGVVLILGFEIQAEERILICHINSPSNLTLPNANDTGRGRLGGFYLAIKRNAYRNIEPTFIEVGSPEDSFLVRLSKLESANCDVVVGIVSSRDMLLAAPVLARMQIMGISSTATTDELDKYLPWVRSLSSSQSAWVAGLNKALRKQKISSVHVIYQPDDTFSRLYKESLSGLPQEKKYHKLGRGNLLDPTEITSDWSRPGNAVVFTTYPTLSIPALTQLKNYAITKDYNLRNVPIFGTQPWLEHQGFKPVLGIESILLRMFILSPWDLKARRSFRSIPKEFEMTYGVSLDHDSSYDFDSMSLVLKCAAETSLSKSMRERIKECFDRDFTYQGLTGLHVFKRGKAHSQRDEIAMPFRSEGYKVAGAI